ncbi:hypothetical protein N7512_007302 [Penicillium capsulatum]|nr:hypothetical protein N7512_007302 [Penicillium capsulatum]
MSGEINVVAVLYPKPDKFDEKVQAHEPDTLLYYSFRVKDKREIVMVERYKNHAAVQAHLQTPYFKQFAAQLPGLCAKPSELRAGGFVGDWRGVSRL